MINIASGTNGCKIKNKSVDEKIMETLTDVLKAQIPLKKPNEDTRISTYELAKRIGCVWSTVNTHCYKLKSEGKINGELIVPEVGMGKKMVWWIP